MRASNAAALLCAATYLAVSSLASAQIAIDSTDVTLNFLGFTGAGIVPSPSAGQLSSNAWVVTGMSDGDLTFGGDGSTADFTRGESDGGVGTGGIYAFDTGGNDVCLGVQASSADFSPGTLTARFRNDLPRALHRIDVSYVIWEFADEARSSSFNFSYSTDGTTFTPVPSADFASAEAIPTSIAWSDHARAVTIATNVAEDGFLYLRWTSDDVSGAGNRDEFCLDDIVVHVDDFCGDGVQTGSEECDDGNGSNTDGCLTTCLVAKCGDDFVDATSEDCDGGGDPACCNLACQFADGASCENGTCASGVCQAPSGGGGEGGDSSGGGSPDPGAGGASGETSAGEGGLPSDGGTGARGGSSGRGGSGNAPSSGGTAGRPGSSGAPSTSGTSSGGTSGRAGSSGSPATSGAAGSSASGTPDNGEDSGGCGCEVPRRSNARHAGLGIGLALLALLLRRRRKHSN